MAAILIMGRSLIIQGLLYSNVFQVIMAIHQLRTYDKHDLNTKLFVGRRR